MLTNSYFQILELLTEKWAKRYPAIREFRLYMGKEEACPYFFVIVPGDNISEENLRSLYALEDGFSLGMLREFEQWALDAGCKFNIDQWGCAVDYGIPVPFIATDSYWLLYPNIRFVEESNPELLTQKKEDKPVGTALDVPREVIEFMEKARPEIELIYNDIKNGQGFSKHTTIADEARKTDALESYSANKDQFSIIDEEDLNDNELYQLITGQEARTFKGRLLQKLVQKQGFRKFDYQHLYKQYNSIKKTN